MTQDVRAYIYCSLGPVISGQISESSVVNTGLITVSGNVVLNGIYAPQRGSVVQLSYYKQGIIGAIGRKLRVLGYSANTVTRTTDVALGCYLTYHQDTEPVPVTVNSTETEDDENLSELERLVLLNPTRARTIFNRCCDVLNITRDQCPLINQFFTEQFELSGSYINIIGDLLKSENYIGYLDANERLRYINTAAPINNGPVLQGLNIIDISPLQSNLLPADVVYSNVNYRNIELDDLVNADVAPSGDSEQVNFQTAQRRSPYSTYGYSIDGQTSSRLYRYEEDNGTVQEESISWQPSTSWLASYDSQGRVVYKTETKSGPWGEYTKTSNMYYSGSEDDGSQEEITTEYAPLQVVIEALGLPPEKVKPLPSDITQAASNLLSGWQRKTIRRTYSNSYSVRTSLYEYTLPVFTSDGAQAIQTYMQSFQDNPEAISTSTVIAMGTGSVLNKSQHTFEAKAPDFNINQSNPISFSSSDNNATGELGEAEESGRTTVTNISTRPEILYTNSNVGALVVEYTPPYLSDDRVIRTSNNRFRVVRSNAQQKARAYATIQNKMRLGQISGQSVVLPIEYLPAIPFSPVYLNFNNIIGQYRFDNVSIAFDGTGILFSADCLFWGGVGQ